MPLECRYCNTALNEVSATWHEAVVEQKVISFTPETDYALPRWACPSRPTSAHEARRLGAAQKSAYGKHEPIVSTIEINEAVRSIRTSIRNQAKEK